MYIHDLEIQLIRSSRKTISLEVKPDGLLIMRAPLRADEKRLRAFAESKYDWLVAHRQKMLERAKAKEDWRAAHPVDRLTMEDIRRLAGDALADIPARVKHFAPLVGVTYGRITIRNQRSKWGSCTAAGNLNFNCLLMLAPAYVRDYVVVHELCHRLEMNHSPRFWAQVARVLPDYAGAKAWLKNNGAALMERMTAGREASENGKSG